MDVTKLIAIHIVSDDRGWVHTHGMDKLGLPELEIRGVPLYFAGLAVGLLNHVAQYMYDGKNGVGSAKPVELNQVMSVDAMSTFKFVKLPPMEGDEAHFEVERWALSDEPMRGMCEMGEPA